MGTLRTDLPFIDNVLTFVKSIDPQMSARLEKKGSVAVDIFSGSASVAWKLREFGFVVHANDIERYTSGWIHSAVSITKDKLCHDIKELYGHDDIKVAMQEFFAGNAISAKQFQSFISIEGDNFFHNANGHLLSYWFEKLESVSKNTQWYYLLQGYLTTLCIKYANSPGTFQTPYKTWGSGNKERATTLQKIIQPSFSTEWLDRPIGKVYHLDAIDFANRFGLNAIDIAFIDPPSDTRQYSSYYNALNIFQQNNKTSKPSLLSKKSTSKLYMGQLIQAWSAKAKWLIINYPDNGLIPIDELIVMLNLCGKNKVIVYQETDSKYRSGKTTTITKRALLVQTNTWQSPTDIQTVVREWKKSESKRIKEDSYVNPLKLNTKIFKIETYHLGWNIYIKNKLFAKIHHTRKVLSCQNDLLTATQEKAWNIAVLSSIELFKLYIAEKKWTKAIKLLRIWRKKKMANTHLHAQMLYSVLHAQGVHKYANQVKGWRRENT